MVMITALPILLQQSDRLERQILRIRVHLLKVKKRVQTVHPRMERVEKVLPFVTNAQIGDSTDADSSTDSTDATDSTDSTEGISQDDALSQAKDYYGEDAEYSYKKQVTVGDKEYYDFSVSGDNVSSTDVLVSVDGQDVIGGTQNDDGSWSFDQ